MTTWDHRNKLLVSARREGGGGEEKELIVGANQIGAAIDVGVSFKSKRTVNQPWAVEQKSCRDVKNIDIYRYLSIREKSLTIDKKIENIDFKRFSKFRHQIFV